MRCAASRGNAGRVGSGFSRYIGERVTAASMAAAQRQQPWRVL
jgi:hypothetical protein